MTADAKRLLDALVRGAMDETGELLAIVAGKLHTRLDAVVAKLNEADTALLDVRQAVEGIAEYARQLRSRADNPEPLAEASAERGSER